MSAYNDVANLAFEISCFLSDTDEYLVRVTHALKLPRELEK
jgi:hypothetical protein